jgi:cysteine desulfurase / selenocysteine lyase
MDGRIDKPCLGVRLTFAMTIDLSKIRAQFPILATPVPGTKGSHPLRYFDHAASTHAPRPVIDAVSEFMSSGYANVHRGNHHLSRTATDAFEDARETLLRFIGGRAETGCVLFSQNTTSALTMAAKIMQDEPGDTIITHLEHHSNDLPHRARGRVHRVDPQGDIASLPKRIESVLKKNKVKLVAVTGASNVTGEQPDVHAIARVAHAHGARILVDAAQLFAHVPIDVKDPSSEDHIDFLAAAGHKSYAPYGSAFLYAPIELCDRAQPVTPGGGTVTYVGRDEVCYTTGPERHEGGTPNVVGAVAFAAAAKWLQAIGRKELHDAESHLASHARARLADVPGLRAYKVGGAKQRLGVFPFLLDGWDHAALSHALDEGWGIATRDGCFCAHPLLIDLLEVKNVAEIRQRLVAGQTDNVPGLVRASLGIYNTREEVDVLAEALTQLGQRKPTAAQRLAVPSGEAS